VKQRYKSFITPTLYQELAKLDLYLTKSDGFCAIQEGVFESKDMELSEKAGVFFRGRFSMFNVPAVVGRDIEEVGRLRLKTLTPAMARNFLKRGIKKGDLLAHLKGNPELAVDLFLFCLGDCPKVRVGGAAGNDARSSLIWKEMAGLPLISMIDESLGVVGGGGFGVMGVTWKKLAVIADKEQQLLLPNMRDCFVSECFVKLVGKEGWLENEAFMKAMNIATFDSKILASSMSTLLPKSWEGKDFVEWSDDNWGGVGGVQIDDARGPNGLWLKLFWSQVKIYDTDTLTLFRKWPLVPICHGELGSCGNVKFFLCLSRKAADLRLKRTLALDYQGLANRLKSVEDFDGDTKKGDLEGKEDDGWTRFFGDEGTELYDDEEEISEDEKEEEEGEVERERGEGTEGVGGQEAEEREGGGSIAEDEDSTLDELPPLDQVPPPAAPSETAPRPPLPVADVVTTTMLPPAPPTENQEAAGAVSGTDTSAVDRLEASQGVQILSLYLKRIRAPAFELAYFADDNITELLLATPDKATFSKKVLLTLSHSTNYWINHSSDSTSTRLTWDELSTGEKDKLLESLVYDEQRIR